MCQAGSKQLPSHQMASEKRANRPRRCSGTGVYIPACLLEGAGFGAGKVSDNEEGANSSRSSSSDFTNIRSHSYSASMSVHTSATGSSPLGRSSSTYRTTPSPYSSNNTHGCSAAARSYAGQQEVMMMSSQARSYGSTQSMNSMQSEYDAWVAASQLQDTSSMAVNTGHSRRHASLELPAMQMSRPDGSRARRYSLHIANNSSASVATVRPDLSQYIRQSGLQYSAHAPAAAGGRPASLTAATAAACYPAGRCSGSYAPNGGYCQPQVQQQRHHSQQLPELLGAPINDCYTGAPMMPPAAAMPAAYVNDDILLDENVQAMLLDVLQLNDEAYAVPMPGNSINMSGPVLQQQQQLQMPARASFEAAGGSCTMASLSALYADAAVAAPTQHYGSPLAAYMSRHEQQKLQHQQCVAAAAGADAAVQQQLYGLDASVADVAPASGASDVLMARLARAAAAGVGLSDQAQHKLQELMAAQQLQLEIQSELLQLLSLNTH